MVDVWDSTNHRAMAAMFLLLGALWLGYAVSVGSNGGVTTPQIALTAALLVLSLLGLLYNREIVDDG